MLPLILAHRGDSAHAPENSLPAFEQAVAKGADGVELDLWQCASGEIVVCHDRDLTRLTGKKANLKKLSLSQLNSYPLAPGIGIPSLEDVLKVVAPLTLINLEIKDLAISKRQQADKLVALLKKMGLLEKVLISSFHPLILYRLKRYYPELRFGLIFQKDALLPIRRAWAAKIIHPFSLHPQASLLTKTLVERAKRKNQKVIAWTVNERHDLKRCLHFGVDGIITDDPGWLKENLKS